ncbi:MAG: SDR family NAD(P)-dependent oxidoreductase [Verrucomicrobia bacterium]|nr:SDR family NAD(P)-dependent oxidoreductase [Verrucomicrobiota bacterium]
MPDPGKHLASYSAVVVTGGSSGIGKSFIELGAKLNPELVFCNLSRRSPGEKIASLLGKRLNHFGCDLSRAGEVRRAAEAVQSWLEKAVPEGRILLINNSGIGAFGEFPQPNLERQLEIVDLNVRAVVEMTGCFLPLLRRRGGGIINVASTLGFFPAAFSATYSASKAFVLHWSLALREDLRGSGIRVLALCPGTTSTEFFAAAGQGQGAVVGVLTHQPDEVARKALSALAANRALVVPGGVNGLYTTLGARLPKRWVAGLAGDLMRRLRRTPNHE